MKPAHELILSLALMIVGLEIGLSLREESKHRAPIKAPVGVTTNVALIFTNKSAAYSLRDASDELTANISGLSKQVKDLCDSSVRGWKTAEYWHDAYYKHLAIVHQGPGLIRLDMQLPDADACNPGGIFITSEGTADFTPLAQITMPCGYVWELRWGDRVPETDVPCPCGSPDHWVFKFEHRDEPLQTFGEWTDPKSLTNTLKLLPSNP